VAEETEESSGKKRHTPGQGHRRKSDPAKNKRWARKKAKQKQQKREAARRIWRQWDRLTDEQEKLLGPKGEPKEPRARE
jgi:hypothetical protein